MAQTINADDGSVSGSAGLKSASDGTAILALQTKGTTAATVDASQNMGIGTTSPGSKLDVKGTLRLSGSTSGYVGLAPATAAGSTTYTLPSADGTNGQFLSTNGTGTLAWSTPTGGVTSVSAGNGISVSGTTAVTVALDYYTGSTSTNTSYPIGSYIVAFGRIGSDTGAANNSTVTLQNVSGSYFAFSGGTSCAGTWVARGKLVSDGCTFSGNLCQRTA